MAFRCYAHAANKNFKEGANSKRDYIEKSDRKDLQQAATYEKLQVDKTTYHEQNHRNKLKKFFVIIFTGFIPFV